MRRRFWWWLLALIPACRAVVAAPCPVGYNYYFSVTVNNGQVSAGPHTNFPMLILNPVPAGDANGLKTVANGGKVQSATGLDIIVADTSGTKLNFESLNYVAAAGTIEIHVQQASLADALAVNVCYGNAAIVAYQGTTSTWSASYRGVHHVGDGTTLSLADSTANGFDLTNIAAVPAAAGKIGGGASFNGTTQYLSSAAAFLTDNTTPFTVSAWVNAASTSAGVHNAFSTGGGGATSYSAQFRRDAGDWNFYVHTTGVDNNAKQAGGVTASTWTYLVGTWDGVNMILYVNGVLAQSTAVASPRVFNGTVTSWGADSPDNIVNFWNGSLDELRFQNTARPVGWILTESRNQSAPNTFYAVGTETATATAVVKHKVVIQ